MWIKSFIISLLNRKTQPNRGENIMASTPNYTQDQEAKMVEDYESNPIRETVLKLAQEMGKTPASITSKLSSLGVYKKAERTTKAKAPVVPKSEIVAQAQALFSCELPSLKNMTKIDLEHMIAELQDPTL